MLRTDLLDEVNGSAADGVLAVRNYNNRWDSKWNVAITGCSWTNFSEYAGIFSSFFLFLISRLLLLSFVFFTLERYIWICLFRYWLYGRIMKTSNLDEFNEYYVVYVVWNDVFHG